MNSENFVFWLQGYLELTQEQGMTPGQVQVIKDHIALVLTKVTPSIDVSKYAAPLKPYIYCTNGYYQGHGPINYDGRADESEQIFCSAKPSVHSWAGEKAYENLGLNPYEYGVKPSHLPPDHKGLWCDLPPDLSTMGHTTFDGNGGIVSYKMPDPPASC